MPSQTFQQISSFLLANGWRLEADQDPFFTAASGRGGSYDMGIVYQDGSWFLVDDHGDEHLTQGSGPEIDAAARALYPVW